MEIICLGRSLRVICLGQVSHDDLPRADHRGTCQMVIFLDQKWCFMVIFWDQGRYLMVICLEPGTYLSLARSEGGGGITHPNVFFPKIFDEQLGRSR